MDAPASGDVRAGAAGSGPSRARLWAEFALLFVGVPILMAAFFGQYRLFPVLMGLTLVAIALLAVTPGFRIAELRRRPAPGAMQLAAAFLLATATGCLAVAALLVPDQLLAFPIERPRLWAMVMLFYPLLSALPQELIYRPLFFRRYGALFGAGSTQIAVNAVIFGLGHLFYMNPVTIGLTVVAGAIFAVGYVRHGFLFAVLLHAVAGQIVFTSGLGIFFYHGAVGASP